ncbi:MAG: hypothetical protein ACR2OF_02400 [Hyphomicrobium sp.]
MRHAPPLRKEKSARRTKKVCHFVHVLFIDSAVDGTATAEKVDRGN